MAKRRSKARSAASAARSRSAKPSARKTAGTKPGERRTQRPETLRLRAFQPSLTVNDLERSMRYYCDVLGFIVSQRWNDDKGVLRGVMLKAGNSELGLSQDDWAKGRDRQKGVGVRLWCTTVQDVDTLAARIKGGGGRIAEGPMDQPWGGRSLSVDDPDGFHWTIYSESGRR